MSCMACACVVLAALLCVFLQVGSFIAVKLSPHQDQGATGDAQGVGSVIEEAYNGIVPQLRILGRGGQPTLPSLYWGFPGGVVN